MESNYNLLVVAHPDDESIFFAGLLLQKRERPWHVVCVTDGNADGAGKRRHREFLAACRKLKVKKPHHWTFVDIYEQRVDIELLSQKLKGLAKPKQVFTHGILGEYGHPHHQDVSYAVHRTFHKVVPVWSVAYNCFPDLLVSLTPAQFKIKTAILGAIYGKETQRFSHLLPATFAEGFSRVGFREVEAIYKYQSGQSDLKKSQLRIYRWWWNNLQERGQSLPVRPF